jgi:hypothetical protein
MEVQGITVGPGADLSRLDLRNIDFSGRDLSGVRFRGSNLAGARFVDAILHGTDFSSANLSSADFSGAQFYDPTEQYTLDEFVEMAAGVWSDVREAMVWALDDRLRTGEIDESEHAHCMKDPLSLSGELLDDSFHKEFNFIFRNIRYFVSDVYPTALGNRWHDFLDTNGHETDWNDFLKSPEFEALWHSFARSWDMQDRSAFFAECVYDESTTWPAPEHLVDYPVWNEPPASRWSLCGISPLDDRCEWTGIPNEDDLISGS